MGHPPGETCLLPRARLITVLHINGIHNVRVNFCGCRLGLELRTQLLRSAWWPATPLDPRSAATFTLMRQFHYLNLQGNITAYDFYRGLEFQTDGRLCNNFPVCSMSGVELIYANTYTGSSSGMDDDDSRVAQCQGIETRW